MIFKIFSLRNLAKNVTVLLKLLLVFAKMWSYHCFLRKTPIFCRKLAKSQKIAIITSTPALCPDTDRAASHHLSFVTFLIV
jgi:hypothetical protein